MLRLDQCWLAKLMLVTDSVKGFARKWCQTSTFPALIVKSFQVYCWQHSDSYYRRALISLKLKSKVNKELQSLLREASWPCLQHCMLKCFEKQLKFTYPGVVGPLQRISYCHWFWKLLKFYAIFTKTGFVKLPERFQVSCGWHSLTRASQNKIPRSN